jgi:hypothetical protein
MSSMTFFLFLSHHRRRYYIDVIDFDGGLSFITSRG